MIYFTENDIDRIIEDDVPAGDMTSSLLELDAFSARIEVSARDAMTVCGTEEAVRIYRKAGLTVLNWVASGTNLNKSDLILSARGNAAAVHLIWRTGGVMIEFASGIATRTSQLVSMAKSVRPDVSVAGTRKHPPYLKKMALKALMAGGGIPHRTGLSDTILIFREHLIFTGGYEKLGSVISKVRTRQKERKIVVEAHTLAEALLCAETGVDVIQVDKMPMDQFAICANKCRQMNPRVVMLAAGGINVNNAADYIKAGADVLVTSWMYYAPPADIAVNIQPVAAII
ncbi:ModD protein [Geofilum sp. OHC36d9]|uniref:ModD protein n=1 Tax=Geofilum sp. OHC36d9 TaxID=3458413 RepID=UPI00403331D5